MSSWADSAAAPPHSSLTGWYKRVWSFFPDMAQQSLLSNFRLSYCVCCELFPPAESETLGEERQQGRAQVLTSQQLLSWLNLWDPEGDTNHPEQLTSSPTSTPTHWPTVWLAVCLSVCRSRGPEWQTTISQRQEQQDSRPLPSPTSWLAAWLQGWMDDCERCLLPARGFYLMAL